MQVNRAVRVTPDNPNLPMQYRTPCAWIFAAAIAAAGGAPCLAAEPPQSFSYSHIDLAYDLDASIELHGDSFDSDDSYSAGISYLVHPAIYLFGSYSDANYDLRGLDNLWLTGTSIGIGYRHALGSEALPMDVFAAAAYERLRTRREVAGVFSVESDDGGSLQFGLRAAPTPQLEVNLYVQQVIYGDNPFVRNQSLDALFFGVGSALQVSRHLQLTLTYITGELDYRQLPGTQPDHEVELDRDTLRFGVRWTF
jgi:hypothetical protein